MESNVTVLPRKPILVHSKTFRMKLLQKLFGSSKKEAPDQSQHYSIDDHEEQMTTSASPRQELKNLSFKSTSSVQTVDGKVVSTESSETIEVWGD